MTSSATDCDKRSSYNFLSRAIQNLVTEAHVCEQLAQGRYYRRKLLLGPGAQAPHFYDHGARIYDEPPTFVT